MMATVEGGWACPANSRKWHFFGPDKMSLCRKWAMPFSSLNQLEPEDGYSPDDCAACRRKLNKLLEAPDA